MARLCAQRRAEGGGDSRQVGDGQNVGYLGSDRATGHQRAMRLEKKRRQCGDSRANCVQH
jgi:hypothetical protein